MQTGVVDTQVGHAAEHVHALRTQRGAAAPGGVLFGCRHGQLSVGDVVPMGGGTEAPRILLGTEVSVEFVLIARMASFTDVEMQRYWKRD
ncbi:hypothetical protein BTJ49_00720 [Oleiagrimonas sp. MCCC 1A03011]|nr:hypothetical protein BTJ49_00720 [Oleiagrimonas sp. MCCC 1A03011]